MASGTLHVLAVLALVVASSLGLLRASDTEETLPEKTPVRLVFTLR